MASKRWGRGTMSGAPYPLAPDSTSPRSAPASSRISSQLDKLGSSAFAAPHGCPCEGGGEGGSSVGWGGGGGEWGGGHARSQNTHMNTHTYSHTHTHTHTHAQARSKRARVQGRGATAVHSSLQRSRESRSTHAHAWWAITPKRAHGLPSLFHTLPCDHNHPTP
jgi:hypothetical protein